MELFLVECKELLPPVVVAFELRDVAADPLQLFFKLDLTVLLLLDLHVELDFQALNLFFQLCFAHLSDLLEALQSILELLNLLFEEVEFLCLELLGFASFQLLLHGFLGLDLADEDLLFPGPVGLLFVA